MASAGTPDTLGQHSKQSAAPAQVIELDADELLTYKRRLLDLLEPHETVLTALRRLGGRLDAVQDGADGMPWKRRKSSGEAAVKDTHCLLHAPRVLLVSLMDAENKLMLQYTQAAEIQTSAVTFVGSPCKLMCVRHMLQCEQNLKRHVPGCNAGQNSKPATDSAATNTAATMDTPPASRTGRTVPIENR